MHILVIKLSSLGDLFHSLPTVHALKQGLDARVDWVAHASYQACVEHFTDVARVIPFYRKSFWSTLPLFLRNLRKNHYDLIVDLQGNLKSVMVARMARGSRLLGPSFAREGSKWFYPERAGALQQNRHAVEQALDSARYLGLPVGEPEFPVSFPKIQQVEPYPRVALMPFSRWPTKNWPVSSFVRLGHELHNRSGATIFLIGSHEDTADAQLLSKEMGTWAINRAGSFSLVELGSFLSGMDLAIGNDTGPLHMAVACGVPVLGLYGPTNPVRTGPYGQKHRVITPADSACAPCYRRNCLIPNRFCMSEIRWETVVNEALCMLDKTGL